MSNEEKTIVELKKIKGDYEEVANRCRTTVNKGELGKEPSDKFKRRILMSEHSPIRSLIYCFKISNIKSWIATHFARHHEGVEKWISTQRTDRTGVNRDELPQGARVNMEIEANAQALINMSRKRLCYQASPETREVMEQMKKEVSKRDEFMASVMVKDCVYRNGLCAEPNSCGYNKTEAFKKELEDYKKNLEDDNER